jgi:hypothetical protein
MRSTCLVHLTILHFNTRILSGKQPPVTSYFSGPNIFLSTQFSIILGLCYFFNARHKVSANRLHHHRRKRYKT